MRLTRLFLIVFCFMLSLSGLESACKPPVCMEGFEQKTVAAYIFYDGAQIYVTECGSAAKVQFYRVELFGFSHNESVKLLPIDTVTKSTLTIGTSKCGDASVTICPISRQREFIVIDFDFHRGDDRVGLCVNKYLPGQFGSSISPPPQNSNKNILIVSD